MRRFVLTRCPYKTNVSHSPGGANPHYFEILIHSPEGSSDKRRHSPGVSTNKLYFPLTRCSLTQPSLSDGVFMIILILTLLCFA